MATFKRFEEIESWKKSRELTNLVYQVSRKPAFARDYNLKDQIRRASVSIMSNIAEGHDRGGTAEFIQFLATAKASAAEVRCQLYVAADQGYIDEQEFAELTILTTQTAKMISGLITYLRNSGYKGVKYKTAI
jgi:four helix bundle protein